MLTPYWKVHIVNNLGADIDASTNSGSEHFRVRLWPWKFDSNGAVEYGTEIVFNAASDIADGGTEAGAEQDNTGTSAKYIGVEGRIELSSDDTTHDGTVEVYIELANTSGELPSAHANWNPEEDGILMGSLTFDHDATGTDVKGTNISYE